MIKGIHLRASPLSHAKQNKTPYIIFILLICFPYLKPFNIGTSSDIQPLPLAASLLILILKTYTTKRIHKTSAIYITFIASLMIVFTALYGFDAYYFARGFYGYASLTIVAFATGEAIKKLGYSESEKYLKIIFFIWSAVGFIQTFNPEFATFWRDKLIITAGRGSISLATEPAYFSLAITLISIALTCIATKNKVYLLLSLIISAVIAKSSVGVIYSLAALAIFSSNSPLRLAAYAASAVSIVLFTLAIFQDSRIASVFTNFLSNPKQLAIADQSFGLRLINLLIPIKAFVNDLGVPHGLYQWTYYQYEYLIKYFPEYSWINMIERPDNLGSGRILSIHGQLIFELGILCPIFYLLLWKLIKPHPEHKRIYSILMIMFLNGLTLNSPFLCILLSLCIIENNPIQSSRIENEKSTNNWRRL